MVVPPAIGILGAAYGKKWTFLFVITLFHELDLRTKC